VVRFSSLCLIFSLNFTAVTVAAGPNITKEGASVSVTGHLIPQVDIGLSAFGNVASSTVFLNLDASMDLSVSTNSGGEQACVGASTELAVNIGAEASFFDLFDASTGKTLFKKDFPLLQVRHASITWLPRIPSLTGSSPLEMRRVYCRLPDAARVAPGPRSPC
jgi:hypothetical protein